MKFLKRLVFWVILMAGLIFTSYLFAEEQVTNTEKSVEAQRELTVEDCKLQLIKLNYMRQILLNNYALSNQSEDDTKDVLWTLIRLDMTIVDTHQAIKYLTDSAFQKEYEELRGK